jgi:hypothetical protein
MITNAIEARGMKQMGQPRHFKPGDKAPNNGVYIEIGETGDNVKNPKKLKLKAGDTFPETSNHNRHWTYLRKP